MTDSGLGLFVPEPPEPPEPETSQVRLEATGSSQIEIIKALRLATGKALRLATGLGLLEAKNLVNAVPVVVVNGITHSRAIQVQELLQAAGGAATVELVVIQS